MTFGRVRIYPYLQIQGETAQYLEEDLHRPDPSSITNNTFFTDLRDYWVNVAPRAGEELSAMELPATGEQTPAVTYTPDSDKYRFIIVEGATVLNKVYGWIDSISIIVSRGEKKSILVRWHPDWFLTMGSRSSSVYGSGRILRGPASMARPDPSAPRSWRYKSISDLIPNRTSRYCIVEYIKTVNNYTTICCAWWQIGETITVGGNPYVTINLDGIYHGEIEDEMEIDPDSIIGAWLAPYQPFSTGTVKTTANGVAWRESDPSKYGSGTLSLPSAGFTTDDNQKSILMDSYGSPAWTVPWGYTIHYCNYMYNIGTGYCSVIYSFNEGNNAQYNEGLVVEVPLITVPITSNAWASYNYSGQREYDITMRNIQKDQAAVNGIANIGTSAINGAIAGTLVAAGPGTVAGALAGIVSSAVGTGVSYVTQGSFDSRTQEAVDKLTANQAGTMIITGGGLGSFEKYLINPGDCFIVMERDTESAAELADEQSELGYVTDTFCSDCSTVISGGGGLRIENLTVHGVGPEAGRYISALFARGVHIDISSP